MKLVFAFLLSLIGIVISYNFIDKSIVFFIEKHEINKYFLLNIMSEIPFLIIPTLIIYVLLFPFLFKRFKDHKLFQMFFSATLCVVLAAQIKDILKYVFGRYWADTWFNNNPSLLINNMYGFQFFQKENSSFPSGHSTVTFAFFTVCILYFPRYKIYFIIPMFCVAIGQVGMHYHFLSDVIAGAFLGFVVSKLVINYFSIAHLNKYLISKS